MFSDIFKRLLNFGALFSLYNVDMVTSKYFKFGYASMCGNIYKKHVTTSGGKSTEKAYSSKNAINLKKKK